jgi:thymidylate kinase
MSPNSTGTAGLHLIAEIVGPAGSGKTTLLRALHQRNKSVQIGFPLRRVHHIPLFLGDIFLSLPILLSQSQTGKRLTPREMKRVIYLKVLHNIILRQGLNCPTITVLAQGPVYKLSRLYEVLSTGTRSQSFEKWWNTTLERWAYTLGLVIQLDAPDTILMQRIQIRNRRHRVQDQLEQDAYSFLARYRASCEHIVSKLTMNTELKVLSFDTSQETLEQIVDEVVIHLTRNTANSGRTRC